LGDRVTIPPVEGETATVSVCRGVVEVKTALTLRFALIVTVVGLAVPDASPAQRVNTYPAAGAAVSVTTVPDPYWAWSGAFETAPPFEGETATVNWYWAAGGGSGAVADLHAAKDRRKPAMHRTAAVRRMLRMFAGMSPSGAALITK
jgi:hypothetical protein